MPTDAHNNVSREERRALLEQRRAEVARQMRRLAKELADLDRRLELLPDVGHFAHVEAPNEVVELIEDFIATTDSHQASVPQPSS